MKGLTAFLSVLLPVLGMALHAGPKPTGSVQPSDRIRSTDFTLEGSTDKPLAIYQMGETIRFTLKVCRKGIPVSGFAVKWTRTGDDGLTLQGTNIADEGGLRITTTLSNPGCVRVSAQAMDEFGTHLQGPMKVWGTPKVTDVEWKGGAAVAPDRLTAVSEPADFDSFWRRAVDGATRVPLAPALVEISNADPTVRLFQVRISLDGGKPVTGFLSYPDGCSNHSLPAKVVFHGYGVHRGRQMGWDEAGKILFEVNAHGQPLETDEIAFAQFRQGLDGYGFRKEANTHPTNAYFYGMALRVVRSLQYVKTLGLWNGRDLTASGYSQGGLQALWAAALDRDVTLVKAGSPWLCDLGGSTLGRLPGWRPEYQPALDYFDPIFHARRIRGRAALVARLGDDTCPPSGVWLAYSGIPHTNKSLEVWQGCTHGTEPMSYPKVTVFPDGVRPVSQTP